MFDNFIKYLPLDLFSTSIVSVIWEIKPIDFVIKRVETALDKIIKKAFESWVFKWDFDDIIREVVPKDVFEDIMNNRKKQLNTKLNIFYG